MGKPLRILFVEDSADDAELVLRVLRKGGYEVTHARVETASGLAQALKEGEWDLIISDYSIPGFGGSEALRIVRERRLDLPFIMISGIEGEDLAVKVMNEGAQDFVNKENLSRLIPAIARELREAEVRDERNRVMDALWESEAKYRSLFRNMQSAFAYHRIELDEEDGPVDYVFLEVNEAFEALTGLMRRDVLGRSVTEIIPDPEGSGMVFIDIFGNVALTGEAVMLERRSEQNGRWFSINAYSPERGRFVTLIDDITERKKAEEELKGLLTTLNTLVEHVPEGIFLLDTRNRIAMTNPVGAEHLMAMSGSKMGDTISELCGQPVRELLVSPPGILWHRLAVGERQYEVAGRTVGGMGGTVFVTRDVTEERQREKRLQLQERLAAVGQLASGIAHDFNNILTIINGYAEILLTDEGLPDGIRRDMDAILKSGQRAAELIGQILDFSRRSSSELKVVDIAPFLREFSGFIRRIIPESIEIALDFKPGEFLVRADLAKMQQVLANLAVNARDSMPKGGKLEMALSTLSLGEGDEPPLSFMPSGEWVALSVSDTGEGISPEVAPNIFNPFFTTKEKGKGTGLGLAQVYGIVKQHEGFIDLKTEIGEGSRFTIYLPLARMLSVAQTNPPAGPVPKGHGQTIMVVEDEEVVLKLIEKMLGNLGYNLIMADNGKEALRMFQDRKDEIGLIITDLVMPGMGGLELSEKINAIDPEVKIIAISGYPSGMDEADLRVRGIVGFIPKPFDARRLAEAVSAALWAGQIPGETA